MALISFWNIKNSWYYFRENWCILLTASALMHKVNILQCLSIEVATIHNSTAGLSIKKEEDSTKNQLQQTKQQFRSSKTRTI